jgi:hypothetical protein
MKLVSLALAFLGAAAAQTVDSKDCLAYQLLSTQPDSIIVKFNDKIIKLLVTPETEIWRRASTSLALPNSAPMTKFTSSARINLRPTARPSPQ